MSESEKKANASPSAGAAGGGVDLTKYPDGLDPLKQMLVFLPDEESKEQLLAGFTLFMALM